MNSLNNKNNIPVHKEIIQMYKSNLYNYDSSQEDESQQDQKIAPVFVKSAVFNKKQTPLIVNGPSSTHQNNQSEDEKDNDEDEYHLRPKLKIQKDQKLIENKQQKCMQNISTLSRANKQTISQANINKKALNAAYTFKLKSPAPTRKKHDPVSLFQKNSASWKKDKFLSSRTDLKQGRKLQIQKRNNLYI